LDNLVSLIGRTGKDPETRVTSNGSEVTYTSLATTYTYKDSQGNKQENVSWHNLVIYGKLGAVFVNHAKKGTLISVRGRINYYPYKPNDGEVVKNKIQQTQIIVDHLTLLSSPGNKTETRPNNKPDDDDVPF